MTALPSPGSESLRSVLTGRSLGTGRSIGALGSGVVRDSTAGRGRLWIAGTAPGGCRTIAGAGSGLRTAGTRGSGVDVSSAARNSGRVDGDVSSPVGDTAQGTSAGGGWP